ncbi:unnamed protein product [Tilletia controversa]|nr:unnamed protein product [Tilletia controversa]
MFEILKDLERASPRLQPSLLLSAQCPIGTTVAAVVGGGGAENRDQQRRPAKDLANDVPRRPTGEGGETL